VRWVLPGDSETDANCLAAALNLHPLAAQVLVNRGHRTEEQANAFLSDKLSDLPDPSSMKGMSKAVERLARALRDKQKVTLYGDYDVDGVCSTSLLYLFLRSLGGQVASYIPRRLGEGYGLNAKAIEKIAADGSSLVVSLDCGITSVSEVARANQLGLDVIIVDHHQVAGEIPPAFAILNPHQAGCGYPTRHLCAAGVAFNLCLGLRRQLRSENAFNGRKEPNLRSMLDLVALATVADMMPLTGANRILVKHGLGVLSRAERPGIRALKEVSGLAPSAEVSAGAVGFRLAPRINAAGRLDDASVGFRLLCSETASEARSLAEALDVANGERREIEEQILHGALLQAEKRAPEAKGLVLASDGWHPGVIGIVASRLVERFHRPTVMVALSDELGRGSARSIEGFHLFNALRECSEHLAKFGGHRHAAGLSVERKRLPAFCNAFEQAAARQLSDEDLVPRCRVDACISISELDENAVRGVEVLGPFGNGNPEPVFATRQLRCRPRVLAGRQREGAHLKLTFETAPQLSAIGFGMGNRVELAQSAVDLAYQLRLEEWMGAPRISLRLRDIRVAD
jgi:single-stranded-DNA-specific exonuclease